MSDDIKKIEGESRKLAEDVTLIQKHVHDTTKKLEDARKTYETE